MKNLLIASIMLVVSISSFAQTTKTDVFDGNRRLNPILTAVPSLGITPDSRASGMGDVGAATSADVNSQHWNPSKYAFMDSPGGVSFSYTPWMAKIVKDINLAYLCGYFRVAEKQTVSASLRYFSLGDVDLTNADGTLLTSTQPSEFAVDVAYSRLLSDKLSAAVALRFIYADLSGGMVEELYPGTSVAADISATYRLPIAFPMDDGSFGLGLNISNIGSKMSYDKGNTSLFIPTNMRLGASFEYPIDKFNSITISADLNKLLIPSTPLLDDYNAKYIEDYTAGIDPVTEEAAYDAAVVNAKAAAEVEFDKDYDAFLEISPLSGLFSSFGDASGGFAEEMREIAWAIGLEYAYNNQFMVRAGYFHESDTKGSRKFFTAGAGFKLNMFQLDASYILSAAQTNPLDQTVRFSLSFDMDGLKDLTR